MTDMKTVDTTTKRAQKSEQRATTTEKYRVPYTDILEESDSMIVVMEIPGVNRDNTDIRIEKNRLSVTAKVDHSQHCDGTTTLYTEHSARNYSKSFTLSNEIDQDGITARTEDGVLTLQLPKSKEASPRQIEVS